jgi:hypothetical protein
MVFGSLRKIARMPLGLANRVEDMQRSPRFAYPRELPSPGLENSLGGRRELPSL